MEFLEINTDIFHYLAASKTQIIQSSTKKESETGGSKKKGQVSSSKDTKTSFKPELVREGPPILEDESILLENFQNNDGSPQVRFQIIGIWEKKNNNQTKTKQWRGIDNSLWRSDILGQEQGIQN